VVPPGKAGILIIAATVAPIFIRKLRPAVKLAGQGLVKAGEFVQKMADDVRGETGAEGTSSPEETSNSQVNEHSSKEDAEAAGTKVTTASPTGHEEMERQHAVEAMGDGAVTEPAPPGSRKSKKKLEPDQKLNPKRQGNSRPD
jgi:hypothetical protein